jgi:DNA-binding CsgD family transcriptional regulator
MFLGRRGIGLGPKMVRNHLGNIKFKKTNKITLDATPATH